MALSSPDDTLYSTTPSTDELIEQLDQLRDRRRVARIRSTVSLSQISPDGEDCVRCNKLVIPEVSYAEIDPSCLTNSYGKAEYEIAGIIAITGVMCAACVDAERQSSSSGRAAYVHGAARPDDGRGADELTTPVGPAYLRGLRDPIATALLGAVEDVRIHRDHHDPIEDLVAAGALGLMRLIAAVGEQVCRAIEAPR